MRGEWARFVLVGIVLTTCGALEELLPKAFGVGFPFLLSAAMLFATEGHVASMIAFAAAAGGFEDALSGLPPFASVSFFLLSAVVVRRKGHPLATLLIAYPIYQVWLRVIVSDLNGGLFWRLFLSVPIAFVSAFVLWVALSWRKEVGCET